MNAAQHRRRKARRKNARLAKQREKLAKYFDFNKITSLTTLINSAHICQRGVLWKPSVQRFMLMVLSNCRTMSEKLRDDTYEPKLMNKITLLERGKLRVISPVNYRDRVVQRPLCDLCLTPILENSLIYDNPASRTDMGMAHARKRFDRHFADHVRRYGLDGFLLQFDLSDFFHSISSGRAYSKLERKMLELAGPAGTFVHGLDLRMNALKILSLSRKFVTQEPGLGIGNHTSQLIAIWYASPIDHMFKEVLRVHGYGRYMDDGYAFFGTLRQAEEALQHLKHTCLELGLKLNEKKTNIIRVVKPILYLKRVYRLTSSRRIYTRVCSDSLRRYKRHFVGLTRLVATDKIDARTLYDSTQSYEGVIASAKPRRSFKRVMKRWWKGCWNSPAPDDYQHRRLELAR